MSMQFRVKNSWRLAIVVASLVGAMDGLAASVSPLERVQQLEDDITTAAVKFDTFKSDTRSKGHEHTNVSYQKLRKLVEQYLDAIFGHDGYFSVYVADPQNKRNLWLALNQDPVSHSIMNVMLAMNALCERVSIQNDFDKKSVDPELRHLIRQLKVSISNADTRFEERWNKFNKGTSSRG